MRYVLMPRMCDILIVGAGPVGSVTARYLAEKDLHCLVLDRRPHVAGNCYDEVDRFGVLIHKYGPHYFRTNNEDLLAFLSRFTEWIPGTYIVKSQIDDRLYPFPINLDTLETYFGVPLDEDSGKTFLEGLQIKYPRAPQNSEEFVLSRIGRELFKKFYLGYTLKQWETHPRDLDPSVCGRIPVRNNRYDRYVDHKYQVLPKYGFTKMFRTMLMHPKIEVQTEVDFLESRMQFKPRRATLYTGAIDEYFERKLGPLPWRSLHFEFQNFENNYIQPCVQINYPSLHIPYTRTVEIKHATGQKISSTTISYEYSRGQGDPFYPIPNKNSRKLYEQYREMAITEGQEQQVFFAGRLAEYTYLNTDEAIERGLHIANKIWEALRVES